MKFKVGDKVIKRNGEKWISGCDFEVVSEIKRSNCSEDMIVHMENRFVNMRSHNLELYVEPEQLTEKEKLQKEISTLKLELQNKERLVDMLKYNISKVEDKIKEIEESEKTKTYNVRVYRNDNLINSSILEATLENMNKKIDELKRELNHEIVNNDFSRLGVFRNNYRIESEEIFN